MPKVEFVRALSPWRLDLRFTDGTCGVVSVKDELFGPEFEPLKDPAFFAQVSVDEYGAVCWPNGADLDPDALYDQLRTQAGVA